MAVNLDVAGDMLGFASLRGLLSDHHPLHTLWRRIAPLFVGREQTDRMISSQEAASSKLADLKAASDDV